MKKICLDYQLNKLDGEYTKLDATHLARMASYHWHHMTDIEKEPYRRAAILGKMPEVKRCESPRYVS